MSNAETIAKLNDALSKLIKAYEELQEENNGLNKTIEQLETKVDGLQEDKKNLENELSQLNQNKKEDGSSISTMLGKIENLLGRKSSNDSSTNTYAANATKVETKEQEVKQNDIPSLIDEIIENDGVIPNQEIENRNTIVEETVISTSTTNLEDIRLSKNDSKPGGFGTPSNSFGSNTFHSAFPTTDDKKDEDDEDNGDNKLDLNRMASLLNGMNKR